MTLLIKTNADRWTRMIRATGVVGLVSVVLLFAPIIAISSLGEPSFLASAGEARAFFINGNATWAQAASVLASVSAIGLIWFVIGLCLLLGQLEGSPPWPWSPWCPGSCCPRTCCWT